MPITSTVINANAKIFLMCISLVGDGRIKFPASVRRNLTNGLDYIPIQLLVPEGLDRIQTGRFQGRPETGNNSNQGQNDERDSDHTDGHAQKNVALVVCSLIKCAVEGEGRNSGSENERKHGTNKATKKSQHQSFQQELGENVELARAQGLAQPYLASPLSHRYQHDIHHTNPAN